jgi:hypothetical protein
MDDSKNIELLKQEIIKKNEIIDNLQKENALIIKRNEDNISLLSNEIINLKQEYDKKINSLKDLFTKEIHALKEEIAKNRDKKEEKKRKNELNAIKEDITDLKEKYCSFERVWDNKLDFIESSLSKLMEKEGIERENKNDIESKLKYIFREQNDNQKNTDKNDLEELKNLSYILISSGGDPVKESNKFFEKHFNKRVSEIKNNKILHNLINKKEEIFKFLDELDAEVKLNFDINKFRQEYNLSEKNYSSEYLISKLKENKWDKTKAFCSIINQDKNDF